MAGVDANGLTIKRLSEVLDSLRSRARTKWGNTVNLADDSLLGELFVLVGDEYADLWEGTQGVYNAAYPVTAEGVNLDNVADIVGVQRLSAQSSVVDMVITGTPSTIVQVGTMFEQVGSGNRYLSTSALTLATTSFNKVVFNVTTVSNLANYTITVGGVSKTYTSDASATNLEIAAGLVVKLNEITGVTAVDNLDGTFSASLAGVEERTLSTDVKLTITSISRVVEAEATVTGPVDVDPNTITTLVTPNFGISSVNNPIAGTVGRNEETDTELRARRYESVAIIGAGTADSIRSKVRQLAGVTTAFVIENRSVTTDSEGRPGKSFEVIVQGGDDDEIANTIWTAKPVGIETYGSTTVEVVDSENRPHNVNFSRPTITYIHFQVTYSKYSEEMFPTNGETLMKEAMVNYGNTLGVGQDVILQRFLGPVYSSVAGLSNVTIQVATSPDGMTPGAYSTNNVSIGPLAVSDFNVTRISVTEV